MLPLCSIISIPVGAGSLTASSLTLIPCGDSDATPDDYGNYNWEALTLDASVGGMFSGFYVAGTNNTTIIFPPNFSANRTSRLKEALPLVDAGYNIVTFESRRCAGMGPLSLGYTEVEEVGDVLAYLNSREDVDPERIGIHGFSSAGATAIMAAARYPQLKAVIAVGNYANMNDIIDEHSGSMPSVFFWMYSGALRGTYYLIVGEPMSRLSPLSVIDQIAPRPILLIYGSEEPGVATSDDMLARAGNNATLWVIEGERHGGYREREDYAQRAIAFFDEHFDN